MKEKEVSLKELKSEANNAKALTQVQAAIANFFQLKSWDEAKEKFGESVKPERLLRFKVCIIIFLSGLCFAHNPGPLK